MCICIYAESWTDAQTIHVRTYNKTKQVSRTVQLVILFTCLNLQLIQKTYVLLKKINTFSQRCLVSIRKPSPRGHTQPRNLISSLYEYLLIKILIFSKKTIFNGADNRSINCSEQILTALGSLRRICFHLQLGFNCKSIRICSGLRQTDFLSFSIRS